MLREKLKYKGISLEQGWALQTISAIYNMEEKILNFISTVRNKNLFLK